MQFIPTPQDIVTGHAGPRTSWVVAAVTGHKLYKNGEHSLLRTADLAIGWRLWSAVLMWWMAAWALSNAWVMHQVHNTDVVVKLLVPFGLVNLVVIYGAMGVACVRLCAQSHFNIPRVFKPLWRLALFVPNVAPLWLYLIPFLPVLWTMTSISAIWDFPEHRMMFPDLIHTIIERVKDPDPTTPGGMLPGLGS